MTFRRSLRVGAAILLAAVLAAVLLVRHYAQPEKVAAALIGQARDRLGLELAFAGAPRYAFWPKLSLELDAPVVRRPGVATPLLAAARAGVVLPWSSLRSSTLAIETLRLDAPSLDLDQARAWLAATPGDAQTPDIRARIVIADGRVARAGRPFLTGLALDGVLDLRALDAWWSALAGHAGGAVPLPPLPLPATASVERIDLDGIRLEGVRVEADARP